MGEDAARDVVAVKPSAAAVPLNPIYTRFPQSTLLCARAGSRRCTGTLEACRPPRPCTQWRLEQVVPSPFGTFGSFVTFLCGVAAERAPNLLPPGERVVFLPQQLQGAVFVFLSLPVYSLPSGRALMCFCCWLFMGHPSLGRPLLPARCGRHHGSEHSSSKGTGPPAEPLGAQHGSARCQSRRERAHHCPWQRQGSPLQSPGSSGSRAWL